MATQHSIYGTPQGHRPCPLFIDSKGLEYDAKVLSRMIIQEHKDVIGAHLRVQLNALGLIDSFDRGSTPYQLPYTLA